MTLTTSRSKKILFIMQQPPYGTDIAREGLDMAFAFAAFECSTTLLFMHDGVWQLTAQQQSQMLATKNLELLLQTLPHYDMNEVYVLSESLIERNLNMTQLALVVKCLPRHQLANWLQSFDHIFTF